MFDCGSFFIARTLFFFFFYMRMKDMYTRLVAVLRYELFFIGINIFNTVALVSFPFVFLGQILDDTLPQFGTLSFFVCFPAF